MISGGHSDETEWAVSVLAVTADQARFRGFLVPGYAGDSEACALDLVGRLREAGLEDARALLLFPDGLVGNCDAFLRTLDRELPDEITITGGAAGDAMAMRRTHQYGNEGVQSESVSAVLISGAVEMKVAVSHGCLPIGLPRQVTSAGEGWLEELDGRPAWSVFKEYLDGNPQDLNADGITHLCIGELLEEDVPSEHSPYVIRTPLGLNEETGALFFPGGGIVAGQEIQLTRRDPARILDSARSCAQDLADDTPGRRPRMVLQLDCAGRGRALFGAGASESVVAPVRESFGGDVPRAGFHTFGEIAPLGRRTRYHNYTVVLCAFYDSEPQAPA